MLSQGLRPTLQDLAEEFNVDPRTIRRDIYERMTLFPIEKDNMGRFYFQDGFSLDKSVLEDDEMLHVILAMTQIADVNDTFRQITHSVISKLVVPGIQNPYYIKPELFEPFDTDSVVANRIEDAIAKERIITFQYKGKEHRVEPYKISCFDGLWYLFAKDTEAGKSRTYQATDIESVELTQQVYDTKDIDTVLADVHSEWYEDGNNFNVKVRVSSEISNYFKRKKHLTTQTIEKELDDGSLIVSFDVSHEEDIDNLVKAWLPHIEVIEPKHFRNKIIAELEGYLAGLEKTILPKQSV